MTSTVESAASTERVRGMIMNRGNNYASSKESHGMTVGISPAEEMIHDGGLEVESGSDSSDKEMGRSGGSNRLSMPSEPEFDTSFNRLSLVSLPSNEQDASIISSRSTMSQLSESMDNSLGSNEFGTSYLSNNSMSTLQAPNLNSTSNLRSKSFSTTANSSSSLQVGSGQISPNHQPYMARHKMQNHTLPGTSRLYDHSNSTSEILPRKKNVNYMTPSQRYRLRREKNGSVLKNSIANKEKFFDEQNSSVLELQEGDIDDSLIWNIPMASFSTNSFLNYSKPEATPNSNSKKRINRKNNHDATRLSNHLNSKSETKFSSPKRNSLVSMSVIDFNQMPTSPIPGVQRTSDLQFIKDTTESLSSVYMHSSKRLSKSRLMERNDSAEVLPIELKEASDNGMEDLLLVSEDKLNLVSHTRPSWLPPKDPQERKLHEEQISKSISMASIEQLDRNKELNENRIRDETNRQKYIISLNNGITRNSSLQSLKKMVWETAFQVDLRYSIYDELLESDVRFITSTYIESFDVMMQLLNKMEFPRNKELQIEKLIENSITNKINGCYEAPKNLLLMLQLKSLSHNGIQPGDVLLFYHFLSESQHAGLSLQRVWELVNLVQMTCFNEITKQRYDEKILDKRGISGQYLLQDSSFANEFNSSCLNSETWWNALERIEHNLFMWIIDVIVVANSQCYNKSPVKASDYTNKSWEYYRDKKVVVQYKILVTFALNILLNYHFGFNDFNALSHLDDPNFCIPMPLKHLVDESYINNLFMRKWLHYYKKA